MCKLCIETACTLNSKRHTQTNRQTDRQTDRDLYTQTDRLTERQTYRDLYTQTDRQTDRQTYRDLYTQTDRHTSSESASNGIDLGLSRMAKCVRWLHLHMVLVKSERVSSRTHPFSPQYPRCRAVELITCGSPNLVCVCA